MVTYKKVENKDSTPCTPKQVTPETKSHAKLGEDPPTTLNIPPCVNTVYFTLILEYSKLSKSPHRYLQQKPTLHI